MMNFRKKKPRSFMDPVFLINKSANNSPVLETNKNTKNNENLLSSYVDVSKNVISGFSDQNLDKLQIHKQSQLISHDTINFQLNLKKNLAYFHTI